MGRFANWNLIHLFNFYLAVAFLVSTAMRIGQYGSILGLVRAGNRWPRLFQLVKHHGNLFLTWSTVLPALLALGLLVLNLLASRWIWYDADLTPHELGHWQTLLPFGVFGAAMLGVDCYCTFWVGEVDRALMQNYFDQAEYWLRSWTAPVVQLFTLGYINPRQMVSVEVRKALLEASRLINASLWWVAAQVGLRMAFGLTLWLIYAFSG